MPTCTSATFVDNTACYRKPPLNPQSQLALSIYAKVLELAAIGGTNYTALMTTTLISDAPCLLNKDLVKAALLNVAFINAALAGATVPADIEAKLEAVKCLVLVNPQKLSEIDLWLTCQLGAHAAFIP